MYFGSFHAEQADNASRASRAKVTDDFENEHYAPAAEVDRILKSIRGGKKRSLVRNKPAPVAEPTLTKAPETTPAASASPAPRIVPAARAADRVPPPRHVERTMTPERERELLNMSPLGIRMNNEADRLAESTANAEPQQMSSDRERELLAMSGMGCRVLEHEK